MNTFKDAAIITVAGGAFVAWLGRPVLRALRARFWPHIQGTIESSHINSLRGSRPGARARSYYVSIKYTYTVAGQTYTNNRWSFDGRSPTSSKLVWSESSVLSEYAKGTPVEVYYDPAQPASSVLTLRLSWLTYAVLAFGMLFLASGMSMLFRLAWRFVTKSAV